MKKTTLILSFVIIGNIAQSQQTPMISQYYHIPFVYNPAYSGVTTNPTAFVVNHTQWNTMPGGPVTRAFTFDGSIKERRAGLGVMIFNDVTDITSRTGIYGSYSYRVKLKDNMYLGFGVSLGAVENRIDFSKIIVKDAGDLVLFNQSQTKTTFDGNAGLLFDYKKLKIGFSVPQLFGNKIKYFDNYTRSVYLLSRHYMGSLKYSFDLSKKQSIGCTPMALIRYIPGAPLQYDINALFDWKKIVGIGVTYKSNYAVCANMYFKIYQAFTVGYAYEFITSKINTYSGMSHELLLGYTFGIKRKMELEELQLQIDEMKKMIEEDTELPKRNKLRIDSIQLEIKKIKEDIEKPIGLVVPPTNKPFETVAESNASADKKALAEEQSKNGAAKKAEKISPFKIGTVDADGVRIISKKDFKDSNGTEIKAGYYIVVGTFFYKEYAMAEIKRFKERGFTNTSFIFYEPLHYHYIYANYLTSKEESLAILKKLREAETEVCLLLNVTE